MGRKEINELRNTPPPCKPDRLTAVSSVSYLLLWFYLYCWKYSTSTQTLLRISHIHYCGASPFQTWAAIQLRGRKEQPVSSINRGKLISSLVKLLVIDNCGEKRVSDFYYWTNNAYEIKISNTFLQIWWRGGICILCQRKTISSVGVTQDAQYTSYTVGLRLGKGDWSQDEGYPV